MKFVKGKIDYCSNESEFFAAQKGWGVRRKTSPVTENLAIQMSKKIFA